MKEGKPSPDPSLKLKPLTVLITDKFVYVCSLDSKRTLSFAMTNTYHVDIRLSVAKVP